MLRETSLTPAWIVTLADVSWIFPLTPEGWPVAVWLCAKTWAWSEDAGIIMTRLLSACSNSRSLMLVVTGLFGVLTLVG